MTGYTPTVSGTIATTSMLNSLVHQSSMSSAAGTPGSMEAVLEALCMCQSTLVSLPATLLPLYIVPTIHTVVSRKDASVLLKYDDMRRGYR
jgi:hypothetical protein